MMETPSVAMNQLDLPALYGSFTAGGLDEPSGGGGVVNGAGSLGSQEEPDPASALSRQLQAPRRDARQHRWLRECRGDSFASEAFGQGPDFFLGAFGAEQEKAVERDSRRAQGGRVNLPARVAPDDAAALRRLRYGRPRQPCREE